MAKKNDVVRKGDKVAITYVGQVDSGLYFDRSHEKKPYVCVIGRGKIFPALEKQIIGMKVGETKRIRLLPEEAFGPIKGNLLVEIPLERLPKGLKPKVGMRLMLPLKSVKKPYPFKITRVGEVSVSVDANHPLAGRNVIYEVKVIAIKHPRLKKRME
ncbi:MAG: FKBP-type peptidyl-prolyl cis-trans isomerase [Chlamydiota bacterium]